MDLVEIIVTGKNLARPALESATADAKGLSGVMGKMGTIGGEALLAVGVASVKMASDYQMSTTRLVTSAGESTDKIGMVRKGMLDMAGQVGVSAQDLSKAMYFVEAAGFHAADGLTVLKAAAQGAAAEGADTTTVAKALTDVLVDYHLKGSAAADVTSKMVAAISHGKTNLQEFSGAFANIVPAASAAGISMEDVMSALANMTNHGFTAARAASNLAQALRSLLNPTKPMQKAFAEFGVTTAQLKEHLKGPNGLTDAMEYLSKAATKAGKEGTPAFAAALKQLMGTAPGANAALATVGENFAATSATIKAVGGATADAQGKVQGFALVQKNLGMQVKELQAGFDSLMIELGNKLLPVLTSITSAMLAHKDVVLAVLAGLAGLMAGLAAFSAVMKTVAMVQKLWTAAVWAFNAAMDANPVVLVAIAIVALGVAIYECYTHFKTFRDIVNDVGQFFVVVWKGALQVVGAVFRWFTDGPLVWIKERLADLAAFWRQHGAEVMQVVKVLWSTVSTIFTAALKVIVVTLKTDLAILEAAWKITWAVVSGIIKITFDLVVGIVRTGWDLVVGLFTTAFHLVLNVVGVFLDLITGHWGRAWSDIKHLVGQFASDIWSTVSGFVVNVYHTIVQWFGNVISWLSGLPGKIYHALSGLFDFIGHEASGIYHTVVGWLESIVNFAASIPSKIMGAIGSVGSGIMHAMGFAAGGIVGAATGGIHGGLRMVGEHGPELLSLPPGTTVHSNPDTQRLMGAAGTHGGAGPIILEIHSGGTALDDLLVEILRKAVRVRGGDVQIALGRS